MVRPGRRPRARLSAPHGRRAQGGMAASAAVDRGRRQGLAHEAQHSSAESKRAARPVVTCSTRPRAWSAGSPGSHVRWTTKAWWREGAAAPAVVRSLALHGSWSRLATGSESQPNPNGIPIWRRAPGSEVRPAPAGPEGGAASRAACAQRAGVTSSGLGCPRADGGASSSASRMRRAAPGRPRSRSPRSHSPPAPAGRGRASAATPTSCPRGNAS